MNWNIFWGIYILIFDIAIFIVAYLVGWKSMHKKERCNKKTEGTVIRYSNMRYNGVSLPVVEYTVNGQNYKVVGPKFKASIKKYISTPFSNPIAKQKTNLNTREDLPDVLEINTIKNSFVSISTTPLKELYPIGSKANVYYDEKKPKVSYVERYAGTMLFFSFYLPMFLGICLLILSLYFFFGPAIIII